MPNASEESSADTVRTLVVDDDDLVRGALTSILRAEGYETRDASSGPAALELLARESFDIMLCDMRMPGMDGLDLLQRVVVAYPDLPVILVTGYGTVDAARDALRLGASDFITKPCNMAELSIVVERNLTRRVMQRKTLLHQKRALQASSETILDALLSALDTRDTETEGHSERVTAYTIEMTDIMGLPQDEVYHIERGALLHDIGKIGVPDRVLHKPDKLTPQEWVEMRKHPLIGFRMCSRIEMLRHAADIVRSHHERWDGLGYPDGLAGEEIPLGSRIFSVADAYDAMTSDRPYRSATPYADAAEEIRRFSGTQFEPAVVEVFLSVSEARWQYIRATAGRMTSYERTT